MRQHILNSYGLWEDMVETKPFGTGLINTTWVINTSDKKFILQRINHKIFKHPTILLPISA